MGMNLYIRENTLRQTASCKLKIRAFKNKTTICGDINDFEIESKYHRKIVVLFLKAQNLSLQDRVFRSVFFLYFIKLSAGNGL